MLASKKLSSSRAKLENRYLEAIKRISSAYNSAKSDINKEFQGYRNALNAQSAISKSNTAQALMQKGLSKSGESIQSSILGDMAHMNALASLSDKEAQKLNELNLSRQNALEGVYGDMLSAQNEQEKAQKEMEYQRERDKASDDKWYLEYQYRKSRDAIEDERLKRADERDIYESDREYNFNREKYSNQLEQQKLENELSEKRYLLDKNKNEQDSYIKNQYLELEKSAQEAKAQAEQEESTSSDKKSGSDVGYSLNEKGYIVPDLAPDELIDAMIKGNGNGSWRANEFVVPSELEERVNSVLNDQRIDPDYLNLLAIYARARGIII